MLLRLTLILVLVLAPLRGWAAVTATPVFAQTPMLGRVQILNGTGAYAIASGAATVTNTVALYTCGANGSKITGIVGTSNDTAAATITVFLVPASNVPYAITTVSVPITAGTIAATPPVNFLSPANTPGLPVDSDGNPYILCQSGDVIRVGAKTTAVTANLAVMMVAVGSDF